MLLEGCGFSQNIVLLPSFIYSFIVGWLLLFCSLNLRMLLSPQWPKWAVQTFVCSRHDTVQFSLRSGRSKLCYHLLHFPNVHLFTFSVLHGFRLSSTALLLHQAIFGASFTQKPKLCINTIPCKLSWRLDACGSIALWFRWLMKLLGTAAGGKLLITSHNYPGLSQTFNPTTHISTWKSIA